MKNGNELMNMMKKIEVLQNSQQRNERRIAVLKRNVAILQLGEIATLVDSRFKANHSQFKKFLKNTVSVKVM